MTHIVTQSCLKLVMNRQIVHRGSAEAAAVIGAGHSVIHLASRLQAGFCAQADKPSSARKCMGLNLQL